MKQLTYNIYFISIQGLCLLELVITGRKEAQYSSYLQVRFNISLAES